MSKYVSRDQVKQWEADLALLKEEKRELELLSKAGVDTSAQMSDLEKTMGQLKSLIDVYKPVATS